MTNRKRKEEKDISSSSIPAYADADVHEYHELWQTPIGFLLNSKAAQN